MSSWRVPCGGAPRRSWRALTRARGPSAKPAGVALRAHHRRSRRWRGALAERCRNAYAAVPGLRVTPGASPGGRVARCSAPPRATASTPSAPRCAGRHGLRRGRRRGRGRPWPSSALATWHGAGRQGLRGAGRVGVPQDPRRGRSRPRAASCSGPGPRR
ncbi:hypothetical protein QJS66_09335 [Kocuria rhizophila]|nr:hypothetical protein QJS66_09335 [Kocuria rhizophila]